MTTDAADREPSARRAVTAVVAWALLAALVVAACDDGAASGVPETDTPLGEVGSNDAWSDVNAPDVADGDDLDTRDVSSLRDAQDSDATVEQDADAAMAETDVDFGPMRVELVPTDWVPRPGEGWWMGPCVGVEVPPALRGRDGMEDTVDVGPDGGCYCFAGGCAEIPSGALDVTLRLVVLYTDAVDSNRVAVGPQVSFFLIESDSVAGGWDHLDPTARIRVAVRRYPQATQGEAVGTTILETRHSMPRGPERPWLQGGGQVDEDVSAIELEPTWFRTDAEYVSGLRVALVGPSANYCGDGVLGPHERCEKGDPANEGLCDIACQPQTWVQCEDGACSSRCPRDFECPDPGPCRVAECDSRVGCVWIPTDEGEACETDEVSGWCETGHCVETPRDCVECGAHRRWLDGQCREAERQYSWAPESRTGRVWAEGGVYHAFESSGSAGHFRGNLPGPSPALEIPHGWVDLEYRARPFTADGVPQGTNFTIDGVDGELESTTDEWRRVRLGQRIELEAADWLFFWMSGPWDLLNPDRFTPGGFDIRRIRYSELGLGICSVGVRHPDAEDGWAECVPRVGDAWCGDACVNLLYNRYNCGECGRVCDADLFCEGGECVREPVWRDYVDTFPDDCPEGYFGLDCTGVCPGVAEDGVACSGNGLCHDGLWGNGHCYCHEDPDYGHGLNCEFSCDDGIRNGLEQNIDCGGGVCDPCD